MAEHKESIRVEKEKEPVSKVVSLQTHSPVPKVDKLTEADNLALKKPTEEECALITPDPEQQTASLQASFDRFMKAFNKKSNDSQS